MVIPPRGDTVLHEGDVLIAIGPVPALSKLAQEGMSERPDRPALKWTGGENEPVETRRQLGRPLRRHGWPR